MLDDTMGGSPWQDVDAWARMVDASQQQRSPTLSQNQSRLVAQLLTSGGGGGKGGPQVTVGGAGGGPRGRGAQSMMQNLQAEGSRQSPIWKMLEQMGVQAGSAALLR